MANLRGLWMTAMLALATACVTPEARLGTSKQHVEDDGGGDGTCGDDMDCGAGGGSDGPGGGLGPGEGPGDPGGGFGGPEDPPDDPPADPPPEDPPPDGPPADPPPDDPPSDDPSAGPPWTDCTTARGYPDPENCRIAKDNSWSCFHFECEASGELNCKKMQRSGVCGTEIRRETDDSIPVRVRCYCEQG